MHYKYIIDFCTSCLRIKAQTGQKSCELISMVLTLLANLIFEKGVSDEYLNTVIHKLIKKFINNPNLQKQVFDFTMIVWQRKTQAVDFEIILKLSSN